MKLVPSIIYTAVIVLLTALAVFYAKDWPFQARAFPWLAGITTATLGLLLVVTDIRRLAMGHRLEVTSGQQADIESGYDMAAWSTYKKFARVFGWILVLYAGIWLVGLRVAVVAFFIAYLRLEGRLRWFLIVPLTALMVLFLVYFDQLLAVHWPRGIMGQWLGIKWL